MNLDYIIHQIRSEIQVDALGKGKASIRATARLADIDESALRRHFLSADKNPSKLAETLTQQGFQVRSFSTTGIPDIAVATILEYYAFDAGDRCKSQAQLVCRAFIRIGIRAWMQDITGYQKPEINPDEFLTQQLPYTPKQWECRFKPEFWMALEKLYGLSKSRKACGMFISHWIYGYFPKEVKSRLNEINPVNLDSGFRKNCNHQHFDDKLSIALDMQISIVTTNLIKADNRHDFKKLMKNHRRYSFNLKNLPMLGE